MFPITQILKARGDPPYECQCLQILSFSGDLKTGLDLCRKLKLKSLQKECAEILEQMKQLTEAAGLYEAAGYYDKAAQLNIKLKNWQKIGQLLPHISSPKIQVYSLFTKNQTSNFSEFQKVA